MKFLSIAVACVFLATCCGFALDAKPKIKVADDGFPSGHDTPEGAACDLARAFIKRDSRLFTNTCIKLYVGGKGPEDYAKFLQDTVESIKKEAARTEPSPKAPNLSAKSLRHAT